MARFINFIIWAGIYILKIIQKKDLKMVKYLLKIGKETAEVEHTPE